MKIYIELDFFRGQGAYGRYTMVQALLGSKPMTLRELGEAAGMGKNSPQKAKHYLTQLMNEGMIYREDGVYKLTPKCRAAIIQQ